MLCAIYRSPKRADTYLYLSHPADFSVVPEVLRKSFGEPVHVMTIPLNDKRKLARLTVDELIEHLNESGFYLQLPPKTESLLKRESAL